MHHFYKNRLVRCYLGATRWMPGMRSPEPFTRFDFNDDLLPIGASYWATLVEQQLPRGS